MSLEQTVTIGLIVFVTMTIECIAGFGATVLAMPLLTIILGINQASALMSMVSGLTGILIFILHHSRIDRQVLKQILLFCGIGLPVGMVAVNILPQKASKIILGLFVIFSALKSIFLQHRPEKTRQACTEAVPRAGTQDKVLLILGGVIHGAFACGGPLMTVYAAKSMKDKSVFRVTMTTVWVITAVFLLVKNLLIGGVITAEFMGLYVRMLPVLAASMLVGNRLHKIVPEKVFGHMINYLLLLAGGMTLIMQLI